MREACLIHMDDIATLVCSQKALENLWHLAGAEPAALNTITLSGIDPVLPSSFCIGTAAQASIAAATLAASQMWQLRNNKSQRSYVDMRHAAAEFRSERYLRIDGKPPPELWDAIAGNYLTQNNRWIRLHTNFPAHRDGILELLKCDHDRAAVQKALSGWKAQEMEDEANSRGLLATMMRNRKEWREHEQGRAIDTMAPFTIEQTGDAPPRPLKSSARPLDHIRVLDLTRVIAGPVCGRTLAAHGAEVMAITAKHLPFMAPLVIDNGRGKLSAFLDLRDTQDKSRLIELVGQSDVFIQGYRPGAIASLGFSPEDLKDMRPGIISASLSAYGNHGPWASRRGFDSLVQMATGINAEEADVAGMSGPKTLPCQALDHAAGFILSFAIMIALHRRTMHGGSWHVSTSLAQAGRWIENLGRLEQGLKCPDPDRSDITDYLEVTTSGFGAISAVKPSGILNNSPAFWSKPSMPLGSHPPQWSTKQS